MSFVSPEIEIPQGMSKEGKLAWVDKQVRFESIMASAHEMGHIALDSRTNKYRMTDKGIRANLKHRADRGLVIGL